MQVQSSSESAKKQKTIDLESIQNILDLVLSTDNPTTLCNYWKELSKCDLIATLPIQITTMILQKLTPKELCAIRLVSRIWNERVMHDAVWRPICQEYGIIPKDQRFEWNSPIPIYHDIFRRSLTMAKTWNSFKCKKIEIQYHKGPVLCLLITHLTRIFSGDIDGRIHVWDAQADKYVHCIKAHESHVSCLANYGTTVASGSSDTAIKIFNTSDFVITAILRGHEAAVTSLAFSDPDKHGKPLLFSGSVDKTIRIWNIEEKSCIRILHGQKNTISHLSYLPPVSSTFYRYEDQPSVSGNNKAGYIVSGSNDQSIYIWDLKTSALTDEPKVLDAIVQTNGPVTAMGVYNELPEDEVDVRLDTNDYIDARKPIYIMPFVAYAGSQDTALTTFTLPNLDNAISNVPNEHRSRIWSVSVATLHSRLITTSQDKTAMVWNLKAQDKTISLDKFNSPVVSSAVSPQEEIMCFGTEKGTIILFDFQYFA